MIADLAHYAPTGPVYFYGGSFSSFAAYPFKDFDPAGHERLYETREHHFQAHKPFMVNVHNWIADAPGPAEAKRRGRSTQLRDGWQQIKYQVMVQGIMLGAAANPSFKEALLATEDRPVAEDSPTDAIWGITKNDQLCGLNLLGLALMEVRNDLQGRSEPLERAIRTLAAEFPDWPEAEVRTYL